MRRVLMVTPHFPPDRARRRIACGCSRRICRGRMDADRGHRGSAAYEGRLDPDLAALVPDAASRRAPAWRSAATRWVGLGDLGLRAFAGLRRACRELLTRGGSTRVHHHVSDVSGVTRSGVKAEFGVPFVLDYQDPWVGAWGQSVGGGPDGAPDLKSRVTRARRVARAARCRRGRRDHRRLARDARRHHARHAGCGAAAAGRFRSASRRPTWRRCMRRAAPPCFDPADGLVHLCYVGTLLPKGFDTLRLCCAASTRARRDDPAAARLRLHFSAPAISRARRVAGPADRARMRRRRRRDGGARRLDYLDALTVQKRATGICCWAAPNRTTRPARCSRRCWRGGRSWRSSTKRAAPCRSCGRGVGADGRVIAYGDVLAARARVAAVACHLGRSRRPRLRSGRRRARSGRGVSARSWRASSPAFSIGWPHEHAGPAHRGADTPGAVLAPWFRHIDERAPEIG